MTTDEKLAAILAAVQTDPGNRGLGKIPGDNLFTACPGDFAAACRSIAEHPNPMVEVVTGFYIPTATPPAFETDGPLGSLFLVRAWWPVSVDVRVHIEADERCEHALLSGMFASPETRAGAELRTTLAGRRSAVDGPGPAPIRYTHRIGLECVGPAADGRNYSMRGTDITAHSPPYHHAFGPYDQKPTYLTTLGIGDGGNEIGMGKVPHETVVANIPNGDLIHCRVPTDYLIVAGVSNWGAYALAAGVYVLRGVKPAADLFDPDREREILEVMVRKGPLVDGVTGKQTATVDGLSWEEYAKPLVRIREILES